MTFKITISNTLAVAAFAAIAVAKKHTTTPCTATPSPTCTNTICDEYINSCGQTYGGCYPSCSGFTSPTFTDPGCPTITSSSSTLSASASCQLTVCADHVNECGLMYGGCYPACSGYPTPSFSVPPCPTTSSSSDPIPTASCTLTMCADYINECGMMYGGCYPACSGYPTPTYVPPPCSTTSSTKTKKHCTKTKCVDYVNDCGQTYGKRPITPFLAWMPAADLGPFHRQEDASLPAVATRHLPSPIPAARPQPVRQRRASLLDAIMYARTSSTTAATRGGTGH